MTSYSKRILREYLNTEFFCVEAARGIVRFISDGNIRNGEYEGNEYILKKLDYFNFLVFKEYIDPGALCPERIDITVFKRDELLDMMQPHLDRMEKKKT